MEPGIFFISLTSNSGDMITFLFGVSMGEIIIVFLVILLLFGANKIPEFARMFGKGMNQTRIL
jgi:TatA/E family protein of Tat protein translocase